MEPCYSVRVNTPRGYEISNLVQHFQAAEKEEEL